MGRTTNIAEDHHARTLTGSAVVSRIKLTGWGAVTAGVTALETFTDRGRLWWKYTVSSTTLELFRRPTMLSGDRVAYADDVADGKATLVQDTSSGFSGTCDIDDGDADDAGVNPTADATGDLIVSYADENDLLNEYADVAGYLDDDSKFYAQGTRFEALLRAAKRELDEMLVEKLLDDLDRDDAGRRKLAAISDPKQLATVHALWCCYKLDAHRVGEHPTRADVSQWHFDRANKLLRGMRLAIDDEADGVIDVERRTVDRTLNRL